MEIYLDKLDNVTQIKYQEFNEKVKELLELYKKKDTENNVLRTLVSNKTVAQIDSEENNQYYLKYSEEKIKEVFK